MTDATRRRLVDLSVLAVSALVVGAGALIVADVDGQRPHAPAVPAVPSNQSMAAETAVPATAQSPQTPPFQGLQPAPRPAKRIVYLRQTRPS